MNRMRKNSLRGHLIAFILAAFVAVAYVDAASVTVYAAEVTAMEQTRATIKGDTVNLRSGAGTNYDKVTSLAGGTEVTVTGQATDGDGKVWYQVTLSDGSTAFVRNDFLTLGEVIQEEPAEIEPAEVEEPEEPVAEEPEADNTPKATDKYVAVYENDADGVPFWYLHDNEALNRVKIEDLMKAAEDVGNIGKLEKGNKTMRTALIVLGILVVVLIVVVVILILRLKDYMYYEEEEEEEEPEPRRGGSSFIRRRRDEDEEEEEDDIPPQRPSRASARSGRGEEPVRGARTAARPDPRNPQAARPRESEQTRRARNVMREDDDLEYEFLNLDDE
ncbi:MAG: SH3 domain-containing protein [Lachnospiraceae bacterium]|nr:SH3 domain-containing protein [Lachnospiraceae bacterium]